MGTKQNVAGKELCVLRAPAGTHRTQRLRNGQSERARERGERERENSKVPTDIYKEHSVRP